MTRIIAEIAATYFWITSLIADRLLGPVCHVCNKRDCESWHNQNPQTPRPNVAPEGEPRKARIVILTRNPIPYLSAPSERINEEIDRHLAAEMEAMLRQAIDLGFPTAPAAAPDEDDTRTIDPDKLKPFEKAVKDAMGGANE